MDIETLLGHSFQTSPSVYSKKCKTPSTFHSSLGNKFIEPEEALSISEFQIDAEMSQLSKLMSNTTL
jgi:hypothetical protein